MSPVVIDVSCCKLTATQLAKRICKEDKVLHNTIVTFIKIKII